MVKVKTQEVVVKKSQLKELQAKIDQLEELINEEIEVETYLKYYKSFRLKGPG
ncbi:MULTISPECIES: hypothetical protein [Mucilaginibacter]|uniref:Uncharacterized protein n=1 Tax=Mucilaginibacter rubeus TaxID=2027860 RepID=A0ABX7U4T2_9SPHI|nr:MULTISPECIES: hypothetical protein [Mucilaginibacter]QTE41205.1 hypothetical protein J3L19_19880 [Mucilaginibacter rubeus]QTE47809.1 hypothetical protein J3L21_19865 [Mucilaginibacter rubeus]QTE59200.1 hypothetical protein J3L23_11525 [Mucilaginibacter rubeus]QTE61341.1 hypothetical protein J3L22_22330 [Mucilaginibacter rubeus]QTF60099.1 hypothetical protein J3L20_21970 [Mucilaginibacter rubeus]